MVEVPDGAAPTELEITDLIEGDGAVAETGDFLSMHYVGVLHADGEQFDASWDRGSTFDFRLGQGQVIQGWDAGIVGMAEGGRRLLSIPADQAYGFGAVVASPPIARSSSSSISWACFARRPSKTSQIRQRKSPSL